MRNVVVTALMILLLGSGNLWAGPYSDELSRCVVDNTTQEDRAALVRWMFLALSRHPAVQGIANMDDEALDAANQSMGELITRLLAGTCREETRTAVNYEGEATITAAFTLLGQVAATELMGHPEVASAMSGLETHIDEDALAEVFAED
jgi:hypothetical protein